MACQGGGRFLISTTGAEPGGAAGTARDAEPAPAPPSSGTSPATVTPAVVAAAELLMQVQLTPAQRELAAGNWATDVAPLMERRTGPRSVPLGEGVAPYGSWRPLDAIATLAPDLQPRLPKRWRFVPSGAAAGALPQDEAAIAHAPLWQQSDWLRRGVLTSERLVGLYLDRIARLDTALRSVVTLVPEAALAQARAADQEIAAGRWRGPLHGVPYGLKDIIDTRGVVTTWGAEFLRGRVPAEDAWIARRLREAGGVLLAKLSTGALAMGDVWFGGQTMNPWVPEEGSSGSSAGPAAAVAAGLVSFAIGSETLGSIVSPSTRCGVNGLRPTFGRVGRTGAMTLCWSLDKLGPLARGVEDLLLVLDAINGPDAADPGSAAMPLAYDGRATVKGLRVGYVNAWIDEAPANEVDRQALATAQRLGMVPVPVTLPDWPYASLNTILLAEAAASFEDALADGRLDRLTIQTADAWPNVLRQARFLSAVDLVQAERLRRRVAEEMARVMAQVDVLLVPSLREETLTAGNFTGHPSLTLRAGFIRLSEARGDWAADAERGLATFDPPRRAPHSVTLIGRLYDEGTLGRAALALERALGVAAERPPQI